MNNINNDITIVANNLRSSSKFLRRDFVELQSLQQKNTSIDNYANRSCAKMHELLSEAFTRKYPNKKIFFLKSNFTSDDLEGADEAIVINIMNGFDNFKNALPFFGSAVYFMSRKKDDPNKAYNYDLIAIDLPVIGELYYASAGKGAWVQKSNMQSTGTNRCRLSVKSVLNDILVVMDGSLINAATNISKNIRVFNSNLYAASLLISGSADLLILPESFSIRKILELFIQESGGTFFVHNKVIYAGNINIISKVKNQLKID